MKAAPVLLALVVAGCFASAGSALAQRDRYERQRVGPPMSQDQRQRMREDMREVYKERSAERGAAQGAVRPERPRPMSPEEREKLRRDVQNANRELRR